MKQEQQNGNTTPRGLRPKKSLLISCTIFAVGALLLGIIYSTEPAAVRETATKETPMLVNTTRAETGDFRPSLTALGTVRPSREIILRPRVDGTIVERSSTFTPGARVRKGDKLVQIDTADYEAAVAMRESELQQARASLQIEKGRQNTARQEFGLIEETLSDEQKALVLRRPQLQDAQAAVEAAKTALNLAQLNLERTSVRAPFDAVVISREADLGSQVSAGDPLGRLVGTKEYWVEATVPLSNLDWVEIPESADGTGAAVRIRHRTAWPKGVYRTGTVISIINELEEKTRMARVLIRVEDPLLYKRPTDELPKLVLGSFVQVEIETKPLLGVTRLNRDFVRKNNTVWVMQDGRLRIRPVEVKFSDQEFAYVSSGIEADSAVVTTNLSTVVDGSALRLRPEHLTSGQDKPERSNSE